MCRGSSVLQQAAKVNLFVNGHWREGVSSIRASLYQFDCEAHGYSS
jgi:hypothetical protein